jgi:hypothetical protein
MGRMAHAAAAIFWLPLGAEAQKPLTQGSAAQREMWEPSQRRRAEQFRLAHMAASVGFRTHSLLVRCLALCPLINGIVQADVGGPVRPIRASAQRNPPSFVV